MKKLIYKSVKTLVAATTVLCFSCADLTEVNTNPNTLDAQRINVKYVMSAVLANTANNYVKQYTYGYASTHGIMEAMQYFQRDYIGYEINTFVWSPMSFNASYKPLKDSQSLFDNAETETNEENKKFYKAVALIMRSFWFGFYTSAWGDMPYSEALKSEQQVFKPKYDSQKDIFKGIIADLKTANDLLKGLGVNTAAKDADILFAGNAVNWRKFSNSLRLRYYMRLSEKKTELKSDGLDIAADFLQIISNKTDFPVIESNAENAAIAFQGTDIANSFPGGTLDFSLRSQFYRRKPASPIMDILKETSDPRLTSWFSPVDVQIVISSSKTGYALGADGKPKRYVPTFNKDMMDTSMYVGLRPALKEPNDYNLGSTANLASIKALNASIYVDQGTNPHVSYLGNIYTQNANALVKAMLMSYTELKLITAEAALLGWTTADPAKEYRGAVEASLDQYQIANGSKTVYNTKNHLLEPFDKAGFLTKKENEFTNASGSTAKLELLMSQKWISLWMTPEFWFDWRRTGLPHLEKNVVSGSMGTKIPVRLIYGTDEYILNEQNVQTAKTRLLPAEDTQWAKMWLLAGTSKPW
jgi:hypothetical protein